MSWAASALSLTLLIMSWAASALSLTLLIMSWATSALSLTFLIEIWTSTLSSLVALSIIRSCWSITITTVSLLDPMGHHPAIFFWKKDFTFSPVAMLNKCRFGSGALPAVVVYCSHVANRLPFGDHARHITFGCCSSNLMVHFPPSSPTSATLTEAMLDQATI